MATKNSNSEDIFNIKEFILLVVNRKYYYIISISIAIMLAYTYNQLTQTTYRVSSIIGPVENRRSSLLESNDHFRGLSNTPQVSNLENDINSLRSFNLVSKTVKKLGLETSYYQDGSGFLNSRLFKFLNQPQQVYNNNNIYTVHIDKSHAQTINTNFHIDIIDENSFRLFVSEENASSYNYLDNNIINRNIKLELDTILQFNKTIISPYFKFSVNINKDLIHDEMQYPTGTFFRFNHIDRVTRYFMGQLGIEPVSLRSTLINISSQGQNLGLTVDFLNNYLQEYMNENLAKKNNIAINTINFIDSQLSEISDSLVKSESKLRDYRASNQVTDLTYQGQQALAQLSEVESEISTLKVQEKYYTYILDYFNKNQDIAGLALPSTANVLDPIMNSMILELLELNAERSTILSNRAEKSLFLGQIENQIKLQKQTIIENVKNNLNAMELTMNELNYRNRKLSYEISSLPKTELNMVSMQRQFNITDAMYTFLLQKRSEAAIAMASNIPDYEILEPARYITSSIVSPRKTINYVLAAFIGFFIPSLIILLKLYFNQKITSVNELERIIQEPILNMIYTNYHNTENINTEFPHSSIAESFRKLRSNVLKKAKNYSSNALMVTSAQPRDGKSFIAFNLATSIAAVGIKTLIIDCDLRKPTLHKKLKSENVLGITNYMNNETSIEKIINKSDINNLSYINSGPIHPNASELIEAGKLDELLKFVKSHFDFVVIDTSPTGLVSDASALMKYTSHLLLVCRNNNTDKNIFINTLNFLNSSHLKNIDIVYNDLDVKKSNYKGYYNYYNN